MPENPTEFSLENLSTLDRLVRSIDLAEGFTLFIARCNIPVLRRDLILTATQQLAALGVEVVEVAFEDEPANVRERLRSALLATDEQAEAPVPIDLSTQVPFLVVAEPKSSYAVVAKRAVFISGLESGIPYDQPNSRILAELNLGHDLFPRDAPCPLVIWLPDYAVTAVARYAPDFWAWRSGVFEFETGAAERDAALEHFAVDRPWRTLTNLTPEARRLRRRQLESLLDDYRDLPDVPRVTWEQAGILADLGNACAAAQEYRDAAVYYERALVLYRQLGERRREAMMLICLGYVYNALDNKRQALAFCEEALPLIHQVGDRGVKGVWLNNTGKVYDALGDNRQALVFFEEALPLIRGMEDQAREAMTLNNIGGVYDDLGDKRMALDFYEQALSLQRQVGDRRGEAMTLNNIGLVYSALNDKHKALDFYELALPLQRQVGDRRGEAITLNNIGLVYSDLGEKRKALDFFQQAVGIVHQVDDRWHESMGRANIAGVYEDLGELGRAENELKIVVELDTAIEHPDLAKAQAELDRVRAKRPK